MDLRDTSLGFYRAWHIAIGEKHGLLLALRDAPLDAATLAVELGLDEAATERWCQGAWALGLLTKTRGRYRLAQAHRETLGEPASTAYLGHHFRYLTEKSLTFGALDDLLHGKAPELDLTHIYAHATDYDHVASLSSLPIALRRALTKGIDVLDLGAGLGGWTRAAMQEFPASRFTAADLEVRPLRGLKGATVLDARKLPANAYDLVYMGEVLAAARDPGNALRAAHRALRPGGQLLALEGLLPTGPPRDWGQRLVLAMSLDFSTDGSRFLSPLALRRSLKETGFTNVTIRDLGGSLFQVRARKPQTSRRR